MDGRRALSAPLFWEVIPSEVRRTLRGFPVAIADLTHPAAPETAGAAMTALLAAGEGLTMLERRAKLLGEVMKNEEALEEAVEVMEVRPAGEGAAEAGAHWEGHRWAGRPPGWAQGDAAGAGLPAPGLRGAGPWSSEIQLSRRRVSQSSAERERERD